MRTPAVLLLTVAALVVSAASARASVLIAAYPVELTVETGQPVRLAAVTARYSGQPAVSYTDPSSPGYDPTYVDPFLTTYADPLTPSGTYDWDLDGDGTYETSTGAANTLDYRYPTANLPSGITIGVRVTRPSGLVETATRVQRVCLSTPGNVPGVTLNGGAKFVSRRAVSIAPVWPRCSYGMTLANDAGFATPIALPLGAAQHWTLAPGPDGPRTVYARFPGDGGVVDVAASIVLDQTLPVVSAAKLTVKGTKKKTYRVSVTAKDATSGLATVQLAAAKSRPASAVPFAAQLTVKGGPAPRFVRVQDGAGNVGAWHAIAPPKVKSAPKPKAKAHTRK